MTSRGILCAAAMLGMASAGLGFSGADAQADEVKVGLVMATTGTYAFVGVAATNGAILAAEHLNAQKFFGDDTLNLTTEDNGSVSAQALTLMNRMALRDKAVIIIGPVSTAEAQAVGPVAGELKVPMFTTSSSPATTAIGPWVFRAGQRASFVYQPLAEYAVKTLGSKRCLAVTIRDNEGYIAQKNEFIRMAKEYGAEIVGDEQVLSSDTNFSALATKVVFAKPDCIFASNPPEQGANMVVQLREAGLPADVNIFGNTGMSSPNYIKIGGAAVENTYFPAQYVPTGVNEMSKTFAADYTKKFNTAPDDWAAVGYSMMIVAAHAIKDAGGAEATPQKVRDAMARIKDVEVVVGQGTFSIDPNDREPSFGAAVMMVKDGKFVAP